MPENLTQDKPLIFISYPSEREELVKYLSDFLLEQGFDTWAAYKNIKGSKHYNREVVDAIKKCEAVVVLICREADKDKGNIERELNEAVDSRKPIFPLAVDSIRKEELKNISYFVNLPQWRFWIFGEQNELNLLTSDLKQMLSSKYQSPLLYEDTFCEMIQDENQPSVVFSIIENIFFIIAKFYKVIFIVMLLFGLWQQLKPSEKTSIPARVSMIIADDEAELYAFPKKEFASVHLESGDFVEVAEQSRQEGISWYHVYTYDGKSGWVLEKHLQEAPKDLPDFDDVFYIASNGTPNDIRDAIQRGLDFNIADEFGYTPLHRAVTRNKNPEVIRLLIQHGLDVNSERTMGIWPGTILEDAVRRNNNSEIIRVLLKNGAKRETKRGKYGALELAAGINPNPEVTKILLYAEDEAVRDLLLNGTIRFQHTGVDMGGGFWRGALQNFKVTLLGIAAMNGNSKVARFLIDQGADVNVKSAEGMTALIAAVAFSQSVETVSMLIKAGADINAQDDIGRSALIEAVHVDGRPEIIELLIRAGADVNLQDKYGETALMWSASMPNYPNKDNEDNKDSHRLTEYKNEIVRFLIKSGADVNIHDNNGKTALMYASENVINNSDDTVRILLEAGANLDTN